MGKNDVTILYRYSTRESSLGHVFDEECTYIMKHIIQ